MITLIHKVNKFMKITARQIDKNQQGFTLIELLVVIGILAVLMGIVLVAINPARQFAQSNNARRANDARQILNALGNYMADNKGATPSAGITSTPTNIKSGGVDICSTLVPTYISALPEDPSINGGAAITNCGSTYDSGYQISEDSAGRITINVAPANQQLGQSISVTR